MASSIKIFFDLLVEIGAVALRSRLPAFLADLLVELRAMSLRGRGASAATRLWARRLVFLSTARMGVFLSAGTVQPSR